MERFDSKDGWIKGALLYPVWGRLARQEIRNKYRRATLGPFWVTATMGVTVYFLGVLFGPMLGSESNAYIPGLAIGWVLWSFLSATVNESTELFQNSISVIRNIRLPYPFYIYKCCAKNLILFMHNLVVIVFCCYFYNCYDITGIIIGGLGFLLVIINLLFTSSIVAIACCRFRDLTPLVNSALQFLFFASPILWTTQSAKGREEFYIFNPVYYMLEIVRSPIIGRDVPDFEYLVFSLYTLAIIIISICLYRKNQNQISLWV